MTSFESSKLAAVALPTSIGPVVGLALVFTHEADAVSFGDAVAQYVTSSGRRARSFEVGFSSWPDYGFALTFQIDDLAVEISIHDIGPAPADALQQALAGRQSYYFVVAAIEDEHSGVRMIRPETTHIFLRDVSFDGDVVSGKGGWPEEPLF